MKMSVPNLGIDAFAVMSSPGKALLHSFSKKHHQIQLWQVFSRTVQYSKDINT